MTVILAKTALKTHRQTWTAGQTVLSHQSEALQLHHLINNQLLNNGLHELDKEKTSAHADNKLSKHKKYNHIIEVFIESTSHDIIIGTDTWLHSDVQSSEFMNPSLGYNVYSNDRKSDAHGGVLIAVKHNLEFTSITKSKSNSGTLYLSKGKKWLLQHFRDHQTELMTTISMMHSMSCRNLNNNTRNPSSFYRETLTSRTSARKPTQ